MLLSSAGGDNSNLEMKTFRQTRTDYVTCLGLTF